MEPKPQDSENPNPETPSEDFAIAPFTSITLSLSTLLPIHFISPPKISPKIVKIPNQISSLSNLSLSNTLSPTKPFFKSTVSSNPLQNPLSLNPRRPSDPSNAAGLRRASVVWFRNDLRLHDNESLSSANNESMSVLPVYCFDPRDYGKSSSGFDKTGPYRASFLIESVSNLRKNLQERGSDLIVRIGRPETVLAELVKEVGAEAVYAHREVSHDEVKGEEKIDMKLKDEGVEVKYFWGSTLYHIDDLPFKLEEMPTNYGGFREKVQGLKIRKTIDALDQLRGLPAGGDVVAGEIPSLVDLGLNPTATMTQGKKKKKNDVVVFEAYPESEYNPSRDVLDGDGRITVDDLLNPLHGKPGFSKIRKDVQRMDRKSVSIQPPLPKPQQEKVDRRSTFVYSKKKLSEYEALVKKNREAPTIYFDEDIDVGYSTVGAIASDFRPRTEFEKKMDSLINAKELSEAHKGDGARLLELNKISVEDVKERQDRLAKMRNLLFRHELKAKRIKHIKSKTYRRLLKKDKSKAASTEIEMNPEAAKELAEKQEFKRAEERLTLKHKNTSKWAKRIKKRGFDVQDDGTRAAISEQLQQHALLTRKRDSMHDDESSSDDSTEEDDDDISGDEDDASKLKLLEIGKKRTLEVLDEDDEMPKSGVLSLPFMVRGQKKKKEAADEEARLALQDFDSSLKQLEGDDDDDNVKDNVGFLNGRKVFGAQKKQAPKQSKAKVNTDNYFNNTDSEDDDDDTIEDVNDKNGRMNFTQKDVDIDLNILREGSEIGHDSLFKNFDDISKDSGPKITYEVSLSATNSLKKKRNKKDSDQAKSVKKAKIKKSQVAELASEKDTAIEHGDDDSDSDGETRMVDGVITSGTDYELPSQDDLIRRAFAGDDVEEDFEMTKQEIMNEENPEPEKPVVLPGWGQWTHVQKKRGLPSWMLAEHERAKKKRDEDLKKRPDAHLKHVIISEKVDKKAEKLQTKTLPYPFKDKEHFERSNRMPLGPEFNPATAIGALNRPDVVKKAGVSIKPIKLRK